MSDGEKKKARTKLETSKGIVIAVMTAFIASMAATYTLPIFFAWVSEVAFKIFQTVATLTGSVLLGYYGKAGFENYDKNKKLLNFEEKNEKEGDNG